MIIIFYLTLFLFIFAHGLYYCNIDYDFFARLIVGKTFFQTGGLLNWDFISYMPTHKFIDHEWGSSLIFYLLQSGFGDKGLLIFKGIMYFLTFFLLTRVIFLHNKDAKMHFLFFLVAVDMIPGVIFATLRCQTFTFFFFALWLYVLERVRIKGEVRLLWILPATMIVWCNLHGGCAVGFGLLGMYIIGEALNKKPVKIYIYTLILSLLALLINPYGFDYIRFLLFATTMSREFISEWRSTFDPATLSTHLRFIIYYFSFIVICILVFIKRFINQYKITPHPLEAVKELYSSADKTKLIILFVTMLAPIKALRLQPFFIFSVCALFYNDFYWLFSKRLPKVIDNAKEIILFFLIIIFAASTTYTTKMQCKMWPFPITEIEFIKINNIKGNLLCEFHHGSYAAYRLYPNNLVFMDGKYEEVYHNDLIYRLQELNLGANDWKKTLKNSNTDLIIVTKKYDMYQNIKALPEFKEVISSPEYALFIKKELVRDNFKIPSNKMKYYMDTKYDTNIDWRKNG